MSKILKPRTFRRSPLNQTWTISGSWSYIETQIRSYLKRSSPTEANKGQSGSGFEGRIGN